MSHQRLRAQVVAWEKQVGTPAPLPPGEAIVATLHAMESFTPFHTLHANAVPASKGLCTQLVYKSKTYKSKTTKVQKCAMSCLQATNQAKSNCPNH